MSSPKFRLTILGIKPGYDLETVRLTLANSMNASEQEVDALLQNRAPITQESLPHRDAWMVKSDLLGMGVDCEIKPAPLHGLKERAGTMSLQVPTMHKELTPKPPVIRNARHATRMRSGHGQRNQVRKSPQRIGVLQLAAMAGAIAFCVWFFQARFETYQGVPGPNVASMIETTD